MIIALVFLLAAPIDMVLRPTFRRLALRNVSRRKGEAALVIIGALLGTAIITASYVVGDTVEAAIRDDARTSLGPIDETVRVTTPKQLDQLERTIEAARIPGTDGTLRIESTGAVAATASGGPAAVPNAAMVELDFDRTRALGSDAALTGFQDAGPTPTGDEVVIGRRLAAKLRVSVGQPIKLFAYGSSKTYTVRTIIDDVGVAGYSPVRAGTFGQGRTLPVWVPKGTIDGFVSSAPDSLKAAATPVFEVVVSNVGGVFDSTGGSMAVADQLTTLAKDLTGAQTVKLKSDLLDQAKAAGDNLSQLYSGIGYFSVIAGILLLVNLFVMLSEERKSELGMLRALGFKRNHLVRTFAMEGWVYSVSASVLGALAGVAVGWGVIQATGSILRGTSTDTDFSFPLAVNSSALLKGAMIGFVISIVTAWATSIRISRLNIIRAIRDLADPDRRKSWVAFGFGVLGMLGGLALTRRGFAGPDAAMLLAGPPLLLLSSIAVIGRFIPQKIVIVVASAASLVWGIAIFTFFPSQMGRPGINVFVVQGIVLVAAGVLLVAQADRVWGALAKGLTASGRGLAARLGLAYPLARKFRTSMLLGMYAIVIFTMTFISVLSGVFGNQAPQFANDLRAGYDLYVDSNQGNPVTADQLKSQPGVASVSMLTRGVANASTPKHPESVPTLLTGFDSSFLAMGSPALDTADKAYADDRAVFQAVLDDPNLIIVGQNFGSRNRGGGGPPQENIKVGDMVTIRDASGAERQLKVAGVIMGDFVGNNAYVSNDALHQLVGQRAVQNRAYVQVTPGSDPNQVASTINAAFIENGASARTFISYVNELLTQQLGFFALLRGYLGLGLLIGIAGLGVVMVRAVRERRRQIGMLRAMGFPSATVRRAFILEAAFVALQGIFLGIALGMVTAYNLLTSSDAFGGTTDFSWPWAVLAGIALIPLVASLLATAAPAAQAARIKPAVALRIAD